MSDLIIFLFGFGVTAITATATVLIGLSEARDPNHARQQDLNRLEKKSSAKNAPPKATQRRTNHTCHDHCRLNPASSLGVLS